VSLFFAYRSYLLSIDEATIIYSCYMIRRCDISVALFRVHSVAKLEEHLEGSKEIEMKHES